MGSTFPDRPKTGPPDGNGPAIACAAATAAVTVWALASVLLRIGYTWADPVLVGLVAAAAARSAERPLQMLVTAAWGVAAGAAGALLGTLVPVGWVPWFVTGGGVALAAAWPVGSPLRSVAAVPAGALATVGGHTIGTYLLPVSSDVFVVHGFAGFAEPVAASMLVVVASLMTGPRHRGEPRIYISRYQQKLRHRR